MDMNTEADNTGAEIAPDELSILKDRAKQMGIRHSPNIGLDALRERVNAVMKDAGQDEAPEAEEGAEAQSSNLSPTARKAALRKRMMTEEMRLVRLRITNMNPTKKDLSGEIFTVANKYLGVVKKFVPYGEATDEGYHVPHIIYKQLKARKFLQLKTKKNQRNPGQVDIQQRWVNEFALEVMEPLNKADLSKLAAQQMAAAGLN